MTQYVDCQPNNLSITTVFPGLRFLMDENRRGTRHLQAHPLSVSSLLWDKIRRANSRRDMHVDSGLSAHGNWLWTWRIRASCYSIFAPSVDSAQPCQREESKDSKAHYDKSHSQMRCQPDRDADPREKRHLRGQTHRTFRYQYEQDTGQDRCSEPGGPTSSRLRGGTAEPKPVVAAWDILHGLAAVEC